MPTIGEILDRAGEDTRRATAGLSIARADSIHRRARRRTASYRIVASSVVLAAGVAVGVVAMNRPDATLSGAGTPQSPPPTSTHGVDDTAATVDLATFPALGLELEGWAAVSAGEDNHADPTSPARWIEYWYDDPATHEPIAAASLTLFPIPQGSPDEHSIIIPSDEIAAFDVGSRTVHMQRSTLANSRTFTWRESNTAIASLVVFTAEGMPALTQAQALDVVRAVSSLSSTQWTAALASRTEGPPPTGPVGASEAG